jgi:hypothetical protein
MKSKIELDMRDKMIIQTMKDLLYADMPKFRWDGKIIK